MSKVVTEHKAEDKEPKIPFYLQRYGSSKPDTDDDVDDDADDDAGDDDVDDNDGNQAGTGEKTFTQSQVTAMLTKEKKEGRRSMLRSLGFKSEAEAKSTLGLLQQLVNGKGSDDKGKASEPDDDKDDTEMQEALQRAEAAEAKLACMAVGVNKESIDDALAIAKLKVTDKKDLETVLVEMSKEAKYASFFGDEQSSKGTGSDPGHLKDKDSKKTGSYGAKLAAASVQKKDAKKSSYF